MFSLRRHIAIQSECSTDCGLCQSLGCLHSHQRTLDEVREELRLAEEGRAEVVVFPPNALEHPEVEFLAAMARSHGLNTVFRSRPSQFAGPSLDVILRLADNGAQFELLMDRPTDPALMDRIVELSQDTLQLTPVVIPTRRPDLSVTLDALPFEFRRKLEVLALSKSDSQPQLFDCDELNRWLDEVSHLHPEMAMKPYAELDRTSPLAPPGFCQNEEITTVISSPTARDRVALSVVIAFDRIDQRLARSVSSLERQTASGHEFELLLVHDGSGEPSIIEKQLRSMIEREDLAWTLLFLAHSRRSPASDETPLRFSTAMNSGALYASGRSLAFLEPGTLVPLAWADDAIRACDSGPCVYQPLWIRPQSTDLSEGVARGLPELRLLDSRDQGLQADDWQTLRLSCLCVSVQDFFKAGGFPRCQELQGLAIPFMSWKLHRAGRSVSARELRVYRIVDEVDTQQVESSAWRRLSRSIRETKRLSSAAQNFYVTTLDPLVYRRYFVAMGGSPLVRWLIQRGGQIAVIRPLLEVVHFSLQALRAERPMEFVLGSIASGSQQLLSGLRARLPEPRRRRAK